MSWGYLLLIFLSTAIKPRTTGALRHAMFVTSPDYVNFKLHSSNSTTILAQHFISGRTSSRITCGTICLTLSTCAAFNLYPSGSLQICELLADNLCSNALGNIYLQMIAGGIIYDKVKPGTLRSCFAQKYANMPVTGLCETLRPGCAGTWPNCLDCVQSCNDCVTRYSKTEAYNCTIWPGGPSTKPIFAYCYDYVTYIMKRTVDVSTGAITLNYMMAFPDVNRLVQLHVYTQLQFYFQDINYQSYFGYYANPYIDANGTLSNLTFSESRPVAGVDSLGLNGAVLGLSPFVWVANDTNNCGSFWRFKASNPFNCPGGNVSLFGSVKNINGQVSNTGIHWPGAGTKVLYYGDVSLV